MWRNPAAVVALSAALATPALAAGGPGEAPGADGELRLYMVGNSLTDGLKHAKFNDIAESRHGAGSMTWGHHVIWGTPLDYMWEHGQPHDDNGNGVIGDNEEETLGGTSSRGPNEFISASPNGIKPEDPFRFWQFLPNNQLDAVSIQPFDRRGSSDYGSVTRFANLLKLDEGNVNDEGKVTTDVYLMAQWNTRPQIKREVGGETKTVGHGTLDFAAEYRDGIYTGDYAANNTRRQAYYHGLVERLNDPDGRGKPDWGTNAPSGSTTDFPDTVKWGENRAQDLSLTPLTELLDAPVKLVPVGDAFLAFELLLQAEVDAGTPIAEVETKYGLVDTGSSENATPEQVAEFDNTGDRYFVEHFYTDSTHLNAQGQYFQALVYYATLYGQDPAGLVPQNGTFTPAFETAAQTLAWETVNGHPLTGVNVAVPEPTTVGAAAAFGGLMLLRTGR